MEYEINSGNMSVNYSPNLEISNSSVKHSTKSYNFQPKDDLLVHNFTSSEQKMALSPEAAGIFITLYTITTLLAIIGNVLAIIVFTKGRRSKTDLRPFLLNLAFADLIMALFCIPFTFTNQLLRRWIFLPPTCPLVVFLQLTAVTASVFTNTAIGIDRFFAVAFPLRLRVIARRHAIMISLIWMISITINVVQFKVTTTRVDNYTNTMTCVEDWGDQTADGTGVDARRAYTLFLLFVTYVIPLTTLSVTYSIVGSLLWKRKLPGHADLLRDQQHFKTTMQIVKMVVTIVTLFGLCWLPLHAFTLVLDFNPELLTIELMPILQIFYFVVHWIAMSNSFVNPIIYICMNNNFRQDLKSLLNPHQRSDSLSSNATVMTEIWRDKNGTLRKKRKKMSLPVELETKGHDKEDETQRLKASRVVSCKGF